MNVIQAYKVHTCYLALKSLTATGKNVLRDLSVVHFMALRCPWGSTVIRL